MFLKSNLIFFDNDIFFSNELPALPAAPDKRLVSLDKDNLVVFYGATEQSVPIQADLSHSRYFKTILLYLNSIWNS